MFLELVWMIPTLASKQTLFFLPYQCHLENNIQNFIITSLYMYNFNINISTLSSKKWLKKQCTLNHYRLRFGTTITLPIIKKVVLIDETFIRVQSTCTRMILVTFEKPCKCGGQHCGWFISHPIALQHCLGCQRPCYTAGKCLQ